jgi:hypothetical protein
MHSFPKESFFWDFVAFSVHGWAKATFSQREILL